MYVSHTQLVIGLTMQEREQMITLAHARPCGLQTRTCFLAAARTMVPLKTSIALDTAEMKYEKTVSLQAQCNSVPVA